MDHGLKNHQFICTARLWSVDCRLWTKTMKSARQDYGPWTNYYFRGNCDNIPANPRKGVAADNNTGFMEKSTGTLIAFSGGGDDCLIRLIHSEYCHRNSIIEVITTAAPEPEESGQAYVEAFAFVELGLPHVRFMHIDEENEADSPRPGTHKKGGRDLFYRRRPAAHS